MAIVGLSTFALHAYHIAWTGWLTHDYDYTKQMSDSFGMCYIKL